MDTPTTIQHWLAHGERCAASDTIAKYCSGSWDHSNAEEKPPADLKALRRCRLLLEQCPEMQPKLRRLAHLSRAWAEIISFWDDLCMLQELEDPDWRIVASKAPKTTLMLNTIIERTKP